MINKEEREAMERLKKHLDIVNWFMGDDNSIKRDIITILNSIEKQENRIKELEEINEEHQKENGKLQEKLTRCKIKNEVLIEIIEGKIIRELGTSDLYKEETKDECSRII